MCEYGVGWFCLTYARLESVDLNTATIDRFVTMQNHPSDIPYLVMFS